MLKPPSTTLSPRMTAQSSTSSRSSETSSPSATPRSPTGSLAIVPSTASPSISVTLTQISSSVPSSFGSAILTLCWSSGSSTRKEAANAFQPDAASSRALAMAGSSAASVTLGGSACRLGVAAAGDEAEQHPRQHDGEQRPAPFGCPRPPHPVTTIVRSVRAHGEGIGLRGRIFTPKRPAGRRRASRRRRSRRRQERSALSAGPSDWPPRSTGSYRSPWRSTRSSATAIEKSRGRISSVSSSQRSGVETGAPGFGRTE